MNSVRAVSIEKGDRFELNSKAHNFSYGAFGIEIGDVFTQSFKDGYFTKIPETYSAPIKFKVISKNYLKNNWIQKNIRKIFKCFFYEFDMVCEVIDNNVTMNHDYGK